MENNIQTTEISEFNNVLNLPENASKMDALRAYSEFKINTEFAMKQGNLTENEISQKEAQLNAAREQCLKLLYKEMDAHESCCCCHANNSETHGECEDDCTHNQECYEGCCYDNECDEGCCHDNGCNDVCCYDDGCNEGCCHDNECDEECCHDNEYDEECCHDNPKQECVDTFLGDQNSQFCDEQDISKVYGKSEIGMRPIERIEETIKIVESKFSQSNESQNPVIIEELEEKKKGFCGLGFFCF